VPHFLQRLINKGNYFASSLVKRLAGSHQTCPSCAGAPGGTLDRKAAVTRLQRCTRCELLFRSPTTSARENASFYQSAYDEGFTTELPPPDRLKRWIDTGFAGTEKDYSHYLAVLNALAIPRGARVFDYGCSWGYGSHQLSNRGGYAVDAFEISTPRAEFARHHLKVSMPTPSAWELNSYDVFFSAHVIEHVPSVADMIALGQQLLKPGGLFVAFTPNGSRTFRQNAPRDWHLMWGFVHPQLIDDDFLLKTRPRHPLLLHSAPLLAFHEPQHLDPIRNWAESPDRTPRCLDHVELLFAYTKES